MPVLYDTPGSGVWGCSPESNTAMLWYKTGRARKTDKQPPDRSGQVLLSVGYEENFTVLELSGLRIF